MTLRSIKERRSRDQEKGRLEDIELIFIKLYFLQAVFILGGELHSKGVLLVLL